MISRQASRLLQKGLAPSVRGASTFNHKDVFDLRNQLNEDERSLMDSARDYCQSKLLPRVTEAFRTESKIVFFHQNNFGPAHLLILSLSLFVFWRTNAQS